MIRVQFYFIFLISAFILVESTSKLFVLHAPSGLHFQNNHELRVSKLQDILETVMGYTVEDGYDWRGFEIMNPFTAFANCLLVIHVPGVKDLSFPSKIFHPLLMDGSVDGIFSGITRDVEMRHPENENFMQKVDLGDIVEIRGSPNLVLLSGNETEAPFTLVDELTRLKSVVSQMVKKRNKDGAPDIYWITMNNVAQKMQLEPDANELLSLTLNAMAEKAQKVYDGKAFIVVITNDEDQSLRRSKREVAAKSTNSMADLNLAEDYDEDFPVIFNIILWLSLALVFSLIAISMVIAGMDPGRDSIIYRMTSTRMKKDN